MEIPLSVTSEGRQIRSSKITQTPLRWSSTAVESVLDVGGSNTPNVVVGAFDHEDAKINGESQAGV